MTQEFKLHRRVINGVEIDEHELDTKMGLQRGFILRLYLESMAPPEPHPQPAPDPTATMWIPRAALPDLVAELLKASTTAGLQPGP